MTTGPKTLFDIAKVRDTAYSTYRASTVSTDLFVQIVNVKYKTNASGPVFKLKILSDVQSILLWDIENVSLTQERKALLYDIPYN